MNFKFWVRKLLRITKLNRVIFYIQKIRRGIIPSRYIFFIYLLITIGFAGILSIPAMHQEGKDISFLAALFTSASSFSDTGLVTVSTFDSWTMGGQAVIAILILFGGFGVFTLKIFIFNYVLRLNSGVDERELVNTERGTANIGALSEVIITSITFLLVIIFIGGIGFSLFFYYGTPSSTYAESLGSGYVGIVATGDLSMAFRQGFFHMISTINNAGFDILSSHSLAGYYQNHVFLFFTIVIFVIGGIGYPVIYDLSRHFRIWIKKLRNTYFLKNKETYFPKIRFSLFTKLTLVTYFSVGITMVVLTIAFEATSKNPNTIWNDPIYGSYEDKVFNIIFNVAATRSAGFQTASFSSFTEASTILGSIGMFIGASPSSTGGGIRTTTFAIVLLSLWSKLTGRPSVRIFKRRISDETVRMSFVVLALSVILVFLISFVVASSLSVFGGQIPSQVSEAVNGNNTTIFTFNHIIFEVSSAFGTTGLTPGITPLLNIPSQLAIIFTMFIGQLGISSTVLAWRSSKRKENAYEYLEEGISIG
ncbi:TrkH family potassium uptake protein [Mycoplasmopsis agassizii]|uniref:TrkH family potassium uptake protein n=1 Tax=Mycoplasmopsis agassizii TaxID=33922 RepID=UPI003529CD50